MQRRTLKVVVASQILGGAGLAAGITVGGLLAVQMVGFDGVAGVPAGLYTLGSALAAYLVGRSTRRWGRRVGLSMGFATGSLGAIGVVLAAVADSVPLLFAALLVYGSGTATNLQARYAGTDLALPTRRGQAISTAMVSTTLGAVAGPNLVEPLGTLAAGIGIPALAGPFLLAATAYLAAAIVLVAMLRPDPFLLALRREQLATAGHTATVTDASGKSPHDRARPALGAYIGASVMLLSQVTMVAIMTMTPVHMRTHNHGLTAVGLVISVHIGAMYLPSIATGRLVDKLGRTPMAIAAAGTLLLSGVVAAITPTDSLPVLVAALALLGLGWNFGLIAGTALVVDATDPSSRPRAQGTVDVLIALAGAGGSAMSGMIMSTTNYAILSLTAGALSVLVVPMILRGRRHHAHRR